MEDELQDLKMDLWNTKIELTKLRKDKESFRLKVLHHFSLWFAMEIYFVLCAFLGKT